MTAALQGREALRREEEALRPARGIAALDGKPFDGSRLAAVSAELQALDDAEAEQHRCQAEAATKAETERRAKARARGVHVRVGVMGGCGGTYAPGPLAPNDRTFPMLIASSGGCQKPTLQTDNLHD